MRNADGDGRKAGNAISRPARSWPNHCRFKLDACAALRRRWLQALTSLIASSGHASTHFPQASQLAAFGVNACFQP